jgi:ArsR family transcriptional regulator, zinc-responsive transcriptional repressor
MSKSLLTKHAAVLKALSHPLRLEIVHVLSHRCSDVNALVNMLGTRQSAISQHLSVLRATGIVVPQRKGKEILYCLGHEAIGNIIEQTGVIIADREGKRNQIHLGQKINVPHVIDPVCGMRVSPKTTAFVTSFKRTQYYFCASGCMKRFTRNPRHYVK